MNEIAVTSFYRFHPRTPEEVSALALQLNNFAAESGLKGLVVLASEGVNATLAGTSEVVAKFKDWVRDLPGFDNLAFKDSFTTQDPFRRFRTDIRPEIVTFGHRQATKEELNQTFLTPAEWHQRFSNDSQPVVVDLRNKYETELGKFRGAIDPETDVFTDFPSFVEKANLPKDKEVLMYCTGGIRCEKALGFMLDRGYKNVRQLAGGILKYLEEYPSGAFEGECFVFDHRVAVDQRLEPSARYTLCPHCGNPAATKINCDLCEKAAQVCHHCIEKMPHKACSKNCAHHLGRRGLARSALRAT